MQISNFKTPKGTILPVLDMRGKPYLQVAHRLVWFREECPKHSIETEFVVTAPTEAMARAVIKDEAGRILATAHKTENKQGFPDFFEKAETGAIGRALALIGFGTQFCGDELDEKDRLADSPVPTAGASPRMPAPAAGGLMPCPSGCGPMMVSKYNPNELYCPACKAKRPRAA